MHPFPRKRPRLRPSSLFHFHAMAARNNLTSAEVPTRGAAAGSATKTAGPTNRAATGYLVRYSRRTRGAMTPWYRS